MSVVELVLAVGCMSVVLVMMLVVELVIFSFADMWLVVREANESFSNSLNLVFVFFFIIPPFFEH